MRSPLGHTMSKQWFLPLSISIVIITGRQNSFATVLRPDNSHVLKEIGKSLKDIKSITKAVSSLRKGQDGAGRGGNLPSIRLR